MESTSIVEREPSAEDSAAGIPRQQEIATDALQEARRLGTSSAEVAISSSAGLAINVRMGEVETIEHTRDKALGISVYVGHKKGSAGTTDFSSQAVKECVAAACSIARHTAEDEYAGLADAALIQMAYAFEQATQARIEPTYIPTLEN